MGGVDKFNQLMAVYSISWKSRRWWLKIFYYVLDCCIVNSFISYKDDSKTKNYKYMSQLKYRSMLANELIGNFCARKRKSYVCSVELRRKKSTKEIMHFLM